MFGQCLATLFADSQINGGAKILVTSSFMEIFCIFLCAFSRSDVPGKNYSHANINQSIHCPLTR